MADDFSDAALVIVGHGSTVNADSSAPTYQHADELRRRGEFAQVLEAFWKLEPGLVAALRGAFAPRVFVVPLFISAGYFTDEVIPRELGFALKDGRYERVQHRGKQTIYYCEPVGIHESMTKVLLERAGAVVDRHPFPRRPAPAETALFIAGHGTGNNENSRRAIERQAELIAAMNIYAEVHPVFMEEEPRVGDCYGIAKAKNLVMVPFFISDGLHSFEDIPVMLGESRAAVQGRLQQGQPTWRNPTEKHGKHLWYAASIGSEPLMADVIMAQVREAQQSVA